MGNVKSWIEQEDDVIRKNIHLTNAQIAALIPNRTEAAVADRVRKLGLTRTFTKAESEKLKEVWGKPRKQIEEALPRWNWRQISKRANNMGLPSLAEVRESINLYSILAAMGYGHSMARSWVASGLKVTNDKGSTFKNSSVFVKMKDFWVFVEEFPELVDIARLPDNIEIPENIRKLKQKVKPWVRKRQMTKDQREILAWEFYKGDLSTKELADKYHCTEDYVRAVASKYKQHDWPTKQKQLDVVVNSMLDMLYEMRFIDGKSVIECAELLEVSESSVRRGLAKLMDEVDTTIE